MTNHGEEWVPKVGGCVRVVDTDQFVGPLNKKLKDRDGTVLRVWTPVSYSRPRAAVRFGKRNGRGKEFQHSFPVSYLMPWPKEGADQ
jgi:hypothetical protein